MTTWPDRLIAMERSVIEDTAEQIKTEARLWAEETVRFVLTLANIALFLALAIVAFGS